MEVIEESGSGMLRLRNGQLVFERFMEAGKQTISRRRDRPLDRAVQANRERTGT